MNGNTKNVETKLNSLWLILKYTYGLVAIAAGVDKFFNLLTHWEQYVSPMVRSMLPISLTHFMYLVGVIEIIVGVVILSKFTRLGAYVIMAWLLLIVVNLLSMGIYYDICVRDVVMAVGAYALAQLTEIKESTSNPAQRKY
jgi:uncharacterized membrane protein YphA (DoxX/SURF4 family)